MCGVDVRVVVDAAGWDCQAAVGVEGAVWFCVVFGVE